MYRLGGAFTIINCDFYGNQVRSHNHHKKKAKYNSQKKEYSARRKGKN